MHITLYFFYNQLSLLSVLKVAKHMQDHLMSPLYYNAFAPVCCESLMLLEKMSRFTAVRQWKRKLRQPIQLKPPVKFALKFSCYDFWCTLSVFLWVSARCGSAKSKVFSTVQWKEVTRIVSRLSSKTLVLIIEL